MFDGEGKYSTRTIIYQGMFKKGKKEGFGTLIYLKLNCKYKGEFSNGIINGKGMYIWSNGNRYDGEWKNSLRHGHGTYIELNGDIFIGFFFIFYFILSIGEWFCGYKYGEGVIYYPSGKCRYGKWYNNNSVIWSGVEILGQPFNSLDIAKIAVEDI